MKNPFRRTSDAELAARYEGRESASEEAARKRRASHHRHVPAAAAEGQTWEDKDRAADRRGRDRLTDWDSE
ncbi:hypothetical protein ABZY90_19630 [Streptomyces sp. NPDC006422]|uniref:hypothetical protein n=1 Tax=unclassified Streptomyces TaxID=2593676 RepID=UPI0033B8F4B4